MLLRASVVHGDLPLLVSRSALAALGMVYDLDNHVADFSTVQVSGHPLLTTPSGHPALNVHPGNQGLPPHVHPKMWDAKKSIRGDIQIVAHQEAYMVGTAGIGIGDRLLGSNHRVPQLFYEKKVTPEVRNMLSGDSLDLESFVRWWQLTKITADFWIETPEALIRVHVVPRKSFFNPRDWETQQSVLRDNLFRVLGSVRSTYSISCRSLRDLPVVSDMWEQCLGLPKPCHQCLWVGRTVFNRREFFAPCTSSPGLPGNVPATGMADDESRTSLRSTTSGLGTTSQLDRGGAAQRHYGSDSRDQDRLAPEGPEFNATTGTKGRGDEGGLARPREGDEGGLDAEYQGLPCHAGQHADDDREAQGQHLRTSPEELWPMGGRGGEGERGEHAPRPTPLRDVVPAAGQSGPPRASDDPGQDEQPREVRGREFPGGKHEVGHRPVLGRSSVHANREQEGLRTRATSSSTSTKFELKLLEANQATCGQGQGHRSNGNRTRPQGARRDSSAGNTPRHPQAADGTGGRGRRTVRFSAPGINSSSEEDAPEAGTPKNQDAIENPLGDFPLYHNQATEEDAVEAVHPKNQDAIQNPPGDFSLYHNQATEENAAEAVRPKNQDAIQNSLGDFLLYHNQATEEDATIAGHPEDQEPTGDVIDELESDDEYMVLLTDHVEGIIKDRLLAKDFSVEALTTILENVFGESGEYLPKRGAMPRRTTFGEEDKGARRISLGYYSHGGLRGICNKSAEYASFSIYMKHYILHYHPEARWTSMAVSLNNEAKIHGDYHNLRGTLNYLTCAGGFSSGGGLWREIGKGEHVPEDQEIVERYTDGGEILRGMVLPAKGVVAKFPGEYRHATEPWEGGNRWSITCFTTRSFVESTKNEKRRLRQCGYPVPDLRHLTPDRKFIQMQSDVKQGPPCRRVLPRYSTRKSMWKAAVRASVFLTWSLASLSSAQALMTTSYEKGVTILEIGGFQQSLAVTETINADIAEPISWTELKDNNGKQRVLGIISDFIPNVVWINPPEDSAVHNSDDHDQGILDVCTAVDWCAPEQFARKGSLVVEMTYLSEQDSGKIRAKLDEYGEVTEHLFEDTKFLKARPREDHQAHVTEDEGGDEPRQPPKLGASGITFDETVKPDVAATLRRLHQNLGHPSVSDLVRHLRLAGGSSEILKAAKSLRCETCLRCRGPRSPKPSSEPRLLEFGDVVGVDMMFAYDIEKKKHKLLSIVDFASSYHLVIKVPNQTGETLEKVFLKHWVQIFGAPKTITLDLETGIQDAFSRLSDWYQIDLQTSAGQAHWQAGFCERHGKWWKEIFMRVVEDASVTCDDVETAIAATSMAKNNLRRRCGWAPTHIVFGRSPRDEDDIHDKEIDDGYLVPQTADDAQRRRESIRSSAKAAFLRVRAEDKIRRGTLQRARVRPRDLPNGEMALFWRKDKNNKKGAWRGPGVVIGRQHENYWIARGGRCFLCAPEHVRQASPEELGGLFALRATHEDLQRLIERDHDDEDIFEEGDVDQADIEMPIEIADENELQAIIDDLSMDEGVEDESLELPNGDLRPSERRRRRAAEGGQDGDPEPRPVRRRLRRKGPEEALMMKRAMTKRGKEKQLEKELPWRLIPLDKHELFKAAEAKQWQEHLQLGALLPLSVQESEEVRKNEPDRIIGSRFAYRDKNYSKRRSSPDIEWKPKARLVVAGHCDPDIMTGALRTDSPTVSRTAVMRILQITASRLGQDWTVAAGDVTAAFLNGDAMERRLFLQQPKHGLPGLHPSQLIAIQKGVFGLVDSPRKWWRRFRQDIQCREIKLEDQKVAKFVNSPLDPCVFQLMELDSAGNVKEDTYPLCYAAVHVDDILLAGPRSLNRLVQEQLSHCFPVEEWETDSFDFIGSHIEVLVFRDEIRISQGAYVSSRLFEVEVDTKEDGLAMASAEQLADNRSLIGALSWLASQTRPDLACGVSMAQQLQSNPTVEDVRFTNSLARQALQHGDEAVVLKNLDLSKLLVTVYHDAGWGNAPPPGDDPYFRLYTSDEERGLINTGPWASKQRKAKRRNSKVASQLGLLVQFTEVMAAQGEVRPASVVEWKSHACDRVCRSTFGAETMGCIEGIELGQYVKALMSSLLTGQLHRKSGEEFPLVALTDCRSLYDHFHKDGLPRTPTDRRLAIDIACLRQAFKEELKGNEDDKAPLVWVPTGLQRADLLTKPRKPGDWWRVTTSLTIPVREKMIFEQCKSEVVCELSGHRKHSRLASMYSV